MIFKFIGVTFICIYLLCLLISFVCLGLDYINKKFDEGEKENGTL